MAQGKFEVGQTVYLISSVTTTPSNNTNTGKVDAPKTGDESNISLWIKVMAGALVLVGIAGGYLVIKRRKEEE